MHFARDAMIFNIIKSNRHAMQDRDKYCLVSKFQWKMLAWQMVDNTQITSSLLSQWSLILFLHLVEFKNTLDPSPVA